MRCMKKLARLILLCMLMLTIPVQGAIAASRYCIGERHSTSHVQLQQSKRDLHVLQAHTDDAATIKISFDHCPSSGDCCIGAIIVSEPPVFKLLRPGSEKVDLFFSSYTGHISDGPERPPRF